MGNVRLVAPGFDTYLLLKHCIFVATITGTAGWEAISGGKNALIFGKAWYKSLPGVFEYHDRFQLVDILNYQIDHQQLEKELNALLQKTWAGVVDPAYRVLVEKFGNDTNNMSFYKFLNERIK
jgi:capsule polysaccharide export protein KpsC/LpsZ